MDTKTLEFYKQIQRRPYDVNCRKLIEWNEDEVRKAKRILFKLHNLNSATNNKNDLDHTELYSIPLLSDDNFRFPDTKCRLFRDLRGYNKYKVTDFELKFPIAYSILTYNNVEQLERLLRSIYRAHNVYCIHVDSKSSPRVHAAIRSIVSCFPNVFVATQLEHIVYAGFTRLRADLNCMNDLIEPNFTHPNLVGKRFAAGNWKYLLNLASTEFPLRTNYELTKILHMFNGANDIEVMTKFQLDRVQYSWKV
jgi:beta-1,3-galactosyl-O-glycosyl-glycoprotein beta-1,6-N-acetylglucosaminyltransferase